MDPHGRDPVPETLEKFSVQWYIQELRGLFAAADDAQREGRPEGQYVAMLLQTLAAGFLQPDQIQQNHDARAINEYRAKVPTFTRGTEDYFVAVEIGRWLRVCDEAIMKGASPLQISAIIRPIIEERLSAAAPVTPEPAPAAERPEQPAAQETPATRLQQRIEQELANPEVWKQFENAFVQEAIGRLTEEERKFVITGAVRLATDLMGGLVVVSKPFQHERAKKVARDAKLNQLSPAARHTAIAKVPFSGLEHEWNVDLSPQRKVFGGKQTFGEVLKDDKTVAALFGANSPFGESLLNYASQQEDVFAMAVLPVTDRPYAVIYNKWPVPSNSTPIEHRPSGHETLLGVRLDGVGKAQELFNDPAHAYLLPLIMQLAASKVSERGAYYFDAPFGNHVFREPSPDQKRRPDVVVIANCLTKQRLECKDVEAGSVAEVTSYPALDKVLAASHTSYHKRAGCFAANIKRAQGR